jgi:putative lipoic acid-binding regulatory protein
MGRAGEYNGRRLATRKEGRMDELPSIDLLESTHQFPGPYLFKVIGRQENGFVARTVAAVRQELASPVDPPYRVRESVGGRHVAVSLEAQVLSAHEVLAVYRRIKKMTGLVLFL